MKTLNDLHIAYLDLFRRNFLFKAAIAILLVLAGMCIPVYAVEREEYQMVNLTAGQVGVFDDVDQPGRYGIEYRFKTLASPFGFNIIPAIGAAISDNDAKFYYVDFKHDFYLSDHWLLIPSFALGLFEDSDEIDLGDDLEFRSGFELSYQFQNKYRAGLALYHLSNGGISSSNPGTEVLILSLSIPVLRN